MELSDTVKQVERLLRAGKDNKVSTVRLIEAAAKVAALVIKSVPINVLLPRDYKVQEVGSERFLIHNDLTWINSTGAHPAPTRRGSLMFARDIEEGLLSKLAGCLEQRTATSDAATETLTTATVPVSTECPDTEH